MKKKKSFDNGKYTSMFNINHFRHLRLVKESMKKYKYFIYKQPNQDHSKAEISTSSSPSS